MKIEERGIGGAFLERAAAEELLTKLSNDGWEVEREADVEGNRVDLVARRGEETVFYEFKLSGSPSPADWAGQLVAFQQLARRHHAAFRLVLVRPPRQMDLEIEGVERMLFEALAQDPPWQVADIAGHTLIDDVDGVDLIAVRIHGTIAEIEGEANLGVTLQTGGGEVVSSENFPFTFSATLDLVERRATMIEVDEVDTTSWYGDEADEEGAPDADSFDEDHNPF